MTIDTEHFRKELLEHRTRLLGTIKHHDIGNSSLTEETGELMSSSADNHLADTASETYERELDEGLEDDARDQLRQVDEALARIEAGVYGTCSVSMVTRSPVRPQWRAVGRSRRVRCRPARRSCLASRRPKRARRSSGERPEPRRARRAPPRSLSHARVVRPRAPSTPHRACRRSRVHGRRLGQLSAAVWSSGPHS